MRRTILVIFICILACSDDTPYLQDIGEAQALASYIRSFHTQNIESLPDSTFAIDIRMQGGSGEANIIGQMTITRYAGKVVVQQISTSTSFKNFSGGGYLISGMIKYSSYIEFSLSSNRKSISGSGLQVEFVSGKRKVSDAVSFNFGWAQKS
ncbi:MAG TPA: hypothetical protein VG737_05060, partial [Cyclobacteriaceae bacterium]|nr:hypothetical protein [Cyclobacteriaceae bacterium]